jgi:hypothetical protein
MNRLDCASSGGDVKMKRAMVLSALILLLVPLSSTTAMSTGNHRSGIDGNWRKVEAQQKRQGEKFKKIEREAAEALKSLDGKAETYKSKNPLCPSHGL